MLLQVGNPRKLYLNTMQREFIVNINCYFFGTRSVKSEDPNMYLKLQSPDVVLDQSQKQATHGSRALQARHNSELKVC